MVLWLEAPGCCNSTASSPEEVVVGARRRQLEEVLSRLRVLAVGGELREALQIVVGERVCAPRRRLLRVRNH